MCIRDSNITDSDTNTFPSVRLQVYGMDGQGAPLDFATEPLFASHNGFPCLLYTSRCV